MLASQGMLAVGVQQGSGASHAAVQSMPQLPAASCSQTRHTSSGAPATSRCRQRRLAEQLASTSVSALCRAFDLQSSQQVEWWCGCGLEVSGCCLAAQGHPPHCQLWPPPCAAALPAMNGTPLQLNGEPLDLSCSRCKPAADGGAWSGCQAGCGGRWRAAAGVSGEKVFCADEHLQMQRRHVERVQACTQNAVSKALQPLRLPSHIFPQPRRQLQCAPPAAAGQGQHAAPRVQPSKVGAGAAAGQVQSDQLHSRGWQLSHSCCGRCADQTSQEKQGQVSGTSMSTTQNPSTAQHGPHLPRDCCSSLVLPISSS